MLKKLITLLFTALIGLSFVTTVASADPAKGQKLYIKKLKKPCGFDGGKMATKLKQAEWKAIYDKGELNTKLTEYCPKAKPLKEKFVSHVYDFLYMYASDSGNVPS